MKMQISFKLTRDLELTKVKTKSKLESMPTGGTPVPLILAHKIQIWRRNFKLTNQNNRRQSLANQVKMHPKVDQSGANCLDGSHGHHPATTRTRLEQ